MAKAMLTPQQIGEKWASKMATSSEAYKLGIGAVQESPMAKAAASSELYLKGVQEAVSSGKWQSGLNRVSLQQWKESCLTKGVQRIASGAMAAKNRVIDFQSQWLPFLQANVQRVRSMPKGGLENGIARAVEMIRLNSQFRRQN
jgi:hypothetical protein